MSQDRMDKAVVDRAPALSFLAQTGAEQAVARCPRVAALLPRLVAALETRGAGGPGHRFDLAGLDPLELTLIADVLGEGDVSATVILPDGLTAQVEEAVMAGLWRVRFSDPAGQIAADYLDVAAIPEAVSLTATVLTRTGMVPPPPPEGVGTALALLAEIRAHLESWHPGADNLVVTLSHLPVPAADIAYLQEVLGAGPVRILSRGHAACQVAATGVRHVWSVRYFDSTGGVVLDTVEIGDVPAAALAGAEDMQESARRLKQIERAYFA